MSDPILLPASLPGLLRAGLPCVVTRASARGPGSGRTYAAVWLGELDGERFVARVCALDNGIFSPGMEQLGDEAIVQVDLRDHVVRDHVVRALWRKLRGCQCCNGTGAVSAGGGATMLCSECNGKSEPEPLTAPCWQFMDDDAGTVWALGTPPDEPVEFSARAEDIIANEDDSGVIPALASVDLAGPDRDLLALACVAAHVLGGAT